MQYLRDIVGLAALGWPLTLLVAIAIFFAISIAVAVQVSKRTKRKALWGWGIVLAAYLLIFWDHIPTILVHKYYCEKEAGFWVYKTIDQWKAENPGVMEGLVYNKAMPKAQTPNGSVTVLNQRFVHAYKYEGPFLFNRWRIETEIRDSKNGETIAREVGFSTSQERRKAGWSGWKFWLDRERCDIESHRDQGSFDNITAQFEGAKK